MTRTRPASPPTPPGPGCPQPPGPVRLWAAPVTATLAALLLLAVRVSTGFVDGLTSAWKAGVPFLALLSLAYLLGARRHGVPPAADPSEHDGGVLPG